IVFSSLLMAAVVYQINPASSIWVDFSFIHKVTELSKLIFIGAFIFVVSLLILGVRKSSFTSKSSAI
ncbi:MAG: murein biosynthesis integral membrane protein MurJ, partial [Paraglaciecola sp.]